MNPSRGRSYKKSFVDWVENKIAGINPIDKKKIINAFNML